MIPPLILYHCLFLFYIIMGEITIPNNVTHVTGIASGNGIRSGGMIQGIAPCSRIISLKILDSLGQGNSSHALSAMRWILDYSRRFNIKIVNLSIGTSDRRINLPLQEGVERLWKNGILVVAAAANSNGKRNFAPPPPISPKIITVGSWEDRQFYPSSRGFSFFTKESSNLPTLWASGDNIVSTLSPDYNFSLPNRKRERIIGEHYIPMSGTSMATPYVSGTAALLFEKYPRASCDEIKERLLSLSNGNHGFLSPAICHAQR